MQFDRFRKLCEKAGLKELARVPTAEGAILVGERYQNTNAEYARPAWQTFWFVNRDGMDVGRSLFFDFGASSKEGRINAAIEDAKSWMKDNRESGRYDR